MRSTASLRLLFGQMAGVTAPGRAVTIDGYQVNRIQSGPSTSEAASAVRSSFSASDSSARVSACMVSSFIYQDTNRPVSIRARIGCPDGVDPGSDLPWRLSSRTHRRLMRLLRILVMVGTAVFARHV